MISFLLLTWGVFWFWGFWKVKPIEFADELGVGDFFKKEKRISLIFLPEQVVESWLTNRDKKIG